MAPSQDDNGCRSAFRAASARTIRSTRTVRSDRGEIALRLVEPGSPRSVANADNESAAPVEAVSVEGILWVLEACHPEIAAHSRRVARLAARIGCELGLVPSRVERLRLAGLLHDVGKLGLPDSVLEAQEPLRVEDRRALHGHPELGARLLEADGLEDLRIFVLTHHERPDGRGYPAGLIHYQIPFEASILVVADAYDTLTSKRGYTREAAMDELDSGAGSRFDPEVVDAFIRDSLSTPAGGQRLSPA